jgi:DNA-binding NtrC family response regulator
VDSRVLFVSPNVQDALSLARMLEDVSLFHAPSLREAASKLETEEFQAVLTEAELEDGTWLDVLHLARLAQTELVVTHPWADARFWAEALNLGAYDLLVQPFQAMEVRRVVASASSRRSDARRRAAVS